MGFTPRGARSQYVPRYLGPPCGMRPPPAPHVGPSMRNQRPMGPPGMMMGPRPPASWGPPPPGMHPPHPMGMRYPPPHMMGQPHMPQPPPMRGRGPMPFRPMPHNQKRQFKTNNNSQGVEAGKVVKQMPRNGNIDFSKPFINQSIRNEFKKKEELFKSAKNSRHPEVWAMYCQQRDKCGKIYRDAELAFIGQQKDHKKSQSDSNQEANTDENDYNFDEDYFQQVKTYSCCERDFPSNNKYQKHISEHVVCGLDECSFSAHPKIVEMHVKTLHDTGLYKKVCKFNTPESAAMYQAERRKRYAEVKKAKEEEEMRKRSLDTPENTAKAIRKRKAVLEKHGKKIRPQNNRFGRNDTRLTKADNFKRQTTAGTTRKADNFKRQTTAGPARKADKFKRQTTAGPARKADKFKRQTTAGPARKADKFKHQTTAGPSRKYQRRIPKVKQVSLINEKIDWNGNMFPFKGTKQLENETVDEQDQYDIDDSEWNLEQVKKPVPEEPKIEQVKEIDHPKPVVDSNNSLGALMSAYMSDDNFSDDDDVKDCVDNKLEKDKSEVDSSEEDPPEEKAILRCPFSNDVESVEDAKKQKLGESSGKTSKKRSRKRVHKSTKRQVEVEVANLTDDAFPYRFTERKTTLLEKLLEQEIRDERNQILQCVRYVTTHNFFLDKKL